MSDFMANGLQGLWTANHTMTSNNHKAVTVAGVAFRIVMALVSGFLVSTTAYAQSNGPTPHTDPATGRQYYLEWKYTCVENGPCGMVPHKRFLVRVTFDERPEERIIGVVAPRTDDANAASAERTRTAEGRRAVEQAKRDHPDDAVDELGSDDYQFGSAGTSAALSAFAYGVAARLVISPEQRAHIERLRREIGDLNATIAQQAAGAAATEAQISAGVAERAQAITDALQQTKAIPRINFQDPLQSSADGEVLYATQDPQFALRLHRIRTRIVNGKYSAQLSPVLRDSGLWSVRLADFEHAAGRQDTAEGYARIALAVADVAIGLDPVTGTVRGLYELFTGKNLITGEELSDLSRGLAAVNVVTIGLFATAPKAVQAIGKLGRVLGGTVLEKTTAALTSMARRFPTNRVTAAIGLSRKIGFTAVETSIIVEAKGILGSAGMNQLRAAAARGESATVNIVGRTVIFEPGLAASGMTMFGENGFVLGREAFQSSDELSKTVLHELYRLGTSTVPLAGANAALVASETEKAFDFAQRAFGSLGDIP